MPPGARYDAHFLCQPPHREKAEAAALCRLHPPFDRAPACRGQDFPQRNALHCRRCAGAVRGQPFLDGQSAVRVLAGRRAGFLRLPALLWHDQLCGGGALSPLDRKFSVVSAAFGGAGSFLCAVRRPGRRRRPISDFFCLPDCFSLRQNCIFSRPPTAFLPPSSRWRKSESTVRCCSCK